VIETLMTTSRCPPGSDEHGWNPYSGQPALRGVRGLRWCGALREAAGRRPHLRHRRLRRPRQRLPRLRGRHGRAVRGLRRVQAPERS
jgi:hypothetical protein